MTILKVQKVLPLFLSPSPNTRIKILLSNRNKGVGVRTFRQYFSTLQQTLPTEPFHLPAEPFNPSTLQPFNLSTILPILPIKALNNYRKNGSKYNK